jgi:hypothetical protein
VSVILNKRVKNPHTKAEMIKFLAYLVPQSFMRKGRPHKQDREDQLYKDVFFQSVALRNYLIEALITVYIEAERTGFYEKSSYRFYASMLMEYVWSDSQY